MIHKLSTDVGRQPDNGQTLKLATTLRELKKEALARLP